MRILLCNDDGVHAPGIRYLFSELSKIADVWVVAPHEEKSTTGHSLTLHKPVRVMEIDRGIYGVSGSPADCVNVGIKEIIGARPDLVVSGINRGANLGQDIYYSGTVSAAREAVIMGLPAFAVSLSLEDGPLPSESKLNYGAAATVTRKLIQMMQGMEVPLGTLLNINVPDRPVSKLKGIVVTKQGFRKYSGNVLRRVDHRGRPYYWVGGAYQGFLKEPGSDCLTVDQGYVSVTPVRLDATDYGFMAELQSLFPVIDYKKIDKKKKKAAAARKKK